MGASQTTQQSTDRNPWAPAQGNLLNVLNRSNQLAGNSSVWTPTQSNWTQQGLGQLGALGNQSSFGGDTIRNTVGQTNQGMTTGLNQLQANASGQNLDPNSNPYYRQATHNAMQDASDMVQSQFSGAGRLGSAADTKVLTDRLGNIANQAAMNQYNTNLGYQNQAANTLGQLGMQGTQLSQNVGGLDAQQAGYGLQAGAQQDAFNQAQRMAGVNATNWLAGISNPIAQQGGTTQGTTSTTSNPSMASMIGGGLMTGMGLLSGMPDMSGLGYSSFGSGLMGGGLIGQQATNASDAGSYNMPVPRRFY